MNWEIVAMIAVIALIFMIVGFFLAVIANMITEIYTKRQIELHKAGLPPHGWSNK